MRQSVLLRGTANHNTTAFVEAKFLFHKGKKQESQSAWVCGKIIKSALPRYNQFSVKRVHLYETRLG